jgi:hypothetical protein
MRIKTLDSQVARKSQGAALLEYLEVNDRKVRIDIYSDSYKNQGHCRLETLDKATGKWAVTVFRIPERMETDTELYVKEGGIRNADFAADREWLLKVYEGLGLDL